MRFDSALRDLIALAESGDVGVWVERRDRVEGEKRTVP
jgi:hypothetical protein